MAQARAPADAPAVGPEVQGLTPGGPLGLIRRLSLGAAVVLMAAALALVAAGPLLFRSGAASLDFAMWDLTRIAMAASAVGTLVAVLAVAVHAMRAPTRGAIIGVVVLVACGLVAMRCWAALAAHGGTPPVWESQTDWSRPVSFSAQTLAAREAASAADVEAAPRVPVDPAFGRWSGVSFAEAQAGLGLAPAIIPADREQAVEAARATAERLGWRVTLVDAAGGVVEAENRSPWYGLVSDIAVRMTPEGKGTRIDVRSSSRTPGSDLGANAMRIKAFLRDMEYSFNPDAQ
jgi:fatty-acyl-CoA synthase